MTPIGSKDATDADKTRFFTNYSAGVKTNRDAWVYNFSTSKLSANVERMVGYFNELSRQRCRPEDVDRDPTLFSWDRADWPRLERGESYAVIRENLRKAIYRPFTKTHIYFDRQLNNTVYQQPRLFPARSIHNYGFLISAPGAPAPFSALMTAVVPDLVVPGAGNPCQFFARWRYERSEDDTLELGTSEGEVVDGYRKLDNITDEALMRFQAAYGEFTKDDIFYFVYGLLHSPEYRETYAADLKKMLPRIPLVEDPWPFVEAGRKLSDLHLGYESATPYPLDGLDVEPTGDPYDFFRVQKMSFAKVRDSETQKLVPDRTRVVYNSHIELSGIPAAAYRYMLGSRSAIEWIVDRYRVKTDKASGIVNDPNDWSKEVGDPRYIIDLLPRIVTVSLETMKIVDGLPALEIRKDQEAS
jgi:predicted helicase